MDINKTDAPSSSSIIQEIEILSWERQVGESEEAWEAFALYRDLGVDRSHDKVAKALQKSMALMGGWSRTNAWTARALAYDVYMDRQRQAIKETHQARLLEAHLAEGEKIRQVGSKLLDDKPATGRRKKPVPITSHEGQKAAEMVKIGQGLQRLALGMPTTITKQQVEYQKAVEESLAAQASVVRILQEFITEDTIRECDNCARIAAEIERIAFHQERARALLGG